MIVLHYIYNVIFFKIGFEKKCKYRFTHKHKNGNIIIILMKIFK